MMFNKSLYEESLNDSFFDIFVKDKQNGIYTDEVCNVNSILEAFKSHYNNCIPYKKYCDSLLTKEQINEIVKNGEIDKIPQITSAIFKSMDVYHDDINDYSICKSSGTKGNVSKIFRDKTSITRTLKNIDYGMKYYNDIWPKDMQGFILGPNIEEAGDLWFAYIISLISYIADVDYYISKGTFLIEKLINDLQKQYSKSIAIISPPAIIMRLIDYLKNNNLKLNLPDNTWLITAGGWKSAQNVAVKPEVFYSLIEAYLGIRREMCCDFYNQVEMNTVIIECKEKHKHIPAWMKVVIRDPVTFQPVDYGKEGIITYYDSSAQSYPAFVITDDIGILYKECTCGRKTPYLKVIRRVNTVEQKGCAMKIDMNVINPEAK